MVEQLESVCVERLEFVGTVRVGVESIVNSINYNFN